MAAIRGDIDSSILDRAQTMRRGGSSWPKISESVGVSIDKLRRQIEPGYARRYSRRRSEADIAAAVSAEMIDEGSPSKGIAKPHWAITLGLDGVSARPTQQMLDELNEALSAPRTITAEFNGDPLPGRSALDRMRRQAGSL